MRRSDAFVFPSIRELGAGVVIEAMASGLPCIVTNYGAPGDLAANGRGIRIPMSDINGLITAFRTEIEACVLGQEDISSMAEKAVSYAASLYDWNQKSAYTLRLYKALLDNKSLSDLQDYA